jgi:hypothetical protein
MTADASEDERDDRSIYILGGRVVAALGARTNLRAGNQQEYAL